MIAAPGPRERLLEVTCVFCGRLFMAAMRTARFCRRTCQQKQWRAITMLAGSHGYDAAGLWRRRVPAKQTHD